MHATQYAKALYNTTDAADYSMVIQYLDTMAQLVLEKEQVLRHLPDPTFQQWLGKFTELPTSLATVIIIMHEQHSLKLIPRLAISFRRQLANHGITLIEATVADSSTDLSSLRNHFGAATLLISRHDPDLLAGIRLSTPNGTYESSAKTALRHLHQALTAVQ